MLTFQQKLSIFESFPQLQRKDVSLGRVNFHYEDSVLDKKTVGYHLHPNGNGFVYAGLIEDYRFQINDKGFVNIRDYSDQQLRRLIEQSILSLSGPAPDSPSTTNDTYQAHSYVEDWFDANQQSLQLKQEDDLWYIYAGSSLEMVFETREEAEEYLNDEGFTRQSTSR